MTEKQPSINQLRKRAKAALAAGDLVMYCVAADAVEAAEALRHREDSRTAKLLRAQKGNTGSITPKISLSLNGLDVVTGDYVVVSREPGRIVITAAPKENP